MSNEMIALYWQQSKESKESKDNKDSSDVKCLLCPHYCIIKENRTGKCGIRKNTGGTLYAYAYGKISSIALDPVEKKPLYNFHSGSNILSIGSIGCNFHCPFCQNSTISMEYKNMILDSATPEQIVKAAVDCADRGNIGVAYTYNEPLINYEFVKECCIAVKNAGLFNILVTNGYINEDPFNELLPYIDAMNIDIKGGADRTYNIVGGTLKRVQTIVKNAYKSCHIEVTTLVLPGENEDDVEDIAFWLASIDKNIPYHLSRFFPRYKYKDRSPTPIDTLHRLKDTAGKYLNNIYLGNV